MKFAVDQLADIGVCGISITGGEPFIYQNLPALVKYIRDYGIICIVLTNGVLLGIPSITLPVLDAGLNLICLSLDTVNPEAYYAIRGIPLEPILKGLDYVLEQRKYYSELNISVSCVISKVNINILEELIKYLSERGVTIDFQALHPIFGAKSMENHSIKFTEEDLPQLITLSEKLLRMKQDGYLIDSNADYLAAFPDFSVYRKLPSNFECTSGFTMLAIDYNLDVMSCWPMPPIGNLRKTSLSNLWQSELYNNRRLEMLEVKCPGCWLRCHTEHRSEEAMKKFIQWHVNI